MRVFIAGATGSVGWELVNQAKAGGHYIGTLSRSSCNARKLESIADRVHVADASANVPAFNNFDVLISALGAPVTLSASEKRSFRDVDYAANIRVLQAAEQAGVRRFVYLSAHVEGGYAHTAYIRAHEDFVTALARSSVSYTIVRPTGIFPALNDFVHLARKGIGTVIGNGQARTNPVHPADVAAVVLTHLTSGPLDAPIGGPDILTRQEIAELAFRVLSRKPRILHVPAVIFHMGSRFARMSNPRLGDLLEFVAAVSTTDCVAPPIGRLRLEDHFRTVAAQTSTASP